METYTFILQDPTGKTFEEFHMMASSPILVGRNLSVQNLIDLDDSGNIFVTRHFIRRYWRRFISALLLEDTLIGSKFHICSAIENDVIDLMPSYAHLAKRGADIFVWTTYENSRQLLRPDFRFALYKQDNPIAYERLFLAKTPVGSRALFMWHDLTTQVNGNTLRGVLITSPTSVQRICRSLDDIIAGRVS